MKEIFLSFKDSYFKPLYYGLKKYEYRNRFCQEETRAYLYLSGKTRKIIGILELGKPIRLDLTRGDYKNYPETLKRVDEYISNGCLNAVPIKSLSLFKKPISLEDLRKEIPGFMPPQMYYDLKNNPKLSDILKNIPVEKPIFIHNHSKVYYDNLCVSVSELEKSEEFKKLNQEYEIE